MTKKKEPEVEATEAVPEVQNGTPNPPTTPVDGTEPAYPPEPVEGVDVVPVSAPVFEGGDPGTAVASPANDDPDYYHPAPEAPEADDAFLSADEDDDTGDDEFL